MIAGCCVGRARGCGGPALRRVRRHQSDHERVRSRRGDANRCRRVAADRSGRSYQYLGWGDPQPPADVLSATGIHDLTLAFILAHKGCHPEWDGTRPLLGGSENAAAIAAVRSAGGNVDVSFGGWSGSKLAAACKTVSTLTAAYQQVVDDYGLSAVDIDIEHTEFTKKAERERVIDALADLQREDPDLEISVTFGTDHRALMRTAAP